MYDAEPVARALHQDDLRAATRRKSILFIYLSSWIHCESFHIAEGKQIKSSMLPAYCDPPNPCPLGYTAQVSSSPILSLFSNLTYSQDGCIEDFENNSEFSQKYQVCRFLLRQPLIDTKWISGFSKLHVWHWAHVCMSPAKTTGARKCIMYNVHILCLERKRQRNETQYSV